MRVNVHPSYADIGWRVGASPFKRSSATSAQLRSARPRMPTLPALPQRPTRLHSPRTPQATPPF
ncbi:hypothetical protein B0H17DRAFT_1083232 [Mycena rosella]|uniref:Uncharacterized protein n=1 Tax=Mycena rosella TaxID=1033263 RepID=A0AAD7D0M7_MYCRO|nr:hypothetical protein B0H17DRAFT_1083232 [Mycena rosella]